MATEVLVPPLGQTVDIVTLVTWYKSQGETVTQNEPLFAIETDKATLDVEAPATGVLQRVTAQAGDEVKVLSAIALVVAPDEVLDSVQLTAPSPATVPNPEASQARKSRGVGDRGGREGWVFVSPRARRLADEHNVPLVTLQATGPEGAIVERDVRAYLDTKATPLITPVARRLAEETAIDWRNLKGTGPGGRITRDDVARAKEATLAVDGPAPVEFNEVVDTIPLRSVRAVIAERMARSAASTAHVTLTSQADATALVELRQQLNRDEMSVSYNVLFLYALARALRDYPQLNASLEGNEIRLWRRIHIGLAVDTERGLLVPVVRDVDQKGLLQLAAEVQTLIEVAHNGQCTPGQLTGGTFTLTNLGMFGIDVFSPLINLPESAILGVGRIRRQPVLVGEEVVGRELVWLSLTFDHRLVDGGPAARFLQRVAQLVERPHLLMT